MFTVRTSKPKAGNKNYIRKTSGGWNTCIQGSPTDSECNVLSNCVGYASGRFNEIYNEITGNEGHKWSTLNCNAENFIERATAAGLEISDTPTLGGIMVWSKGEAGVSSDGAGHVAIVERIYDSEHIYTSESSYGGSAFFNADRTYNNGNWVNWNNYHFRGCIVNPAIGKTVVTPVERDTTKDQINIKISCLRIRQKPTTASDFYGYAAKGYYNVLNQAQDLTYTWYQIADDMWVAGVDDVDYLPKANEIDIDKLRGLLEECLKILS